MPSTLDLFVIGNDGHIWSTAWNEHASWAPDWFPLPGRAVFDREHQRIGAVARMPSTLDLFVIGNDNKVWTTAWSEAKRWAPDCWPLPGRAVFDRDHQQISAVARMPSTLDLFVIGNDGHLWTTAWSEAKGWAPDFWPLPGKAVFDRDHQKVAAVSRAPGNLDLFVIGNDGHIWTTFWNEHSGWNPDCFPLPGRAVFDREHQQIAAVARARGNLDLFVIGNDGHIWSTAWSEAKGWAPDCFPLPGRAVFDREHQRVTAVARARGNLDLFVIGNDGHLWSTAWNEHTSWAPDWFPLPGKAVFDRDHQQFAVTARTSQNLDLFAIGSDDGHIWSTFWGPRHSMTLDVSVDKTSTIVPSQVGLHIAATDGIVSQTEWKATKNGAVLPGVGDNVPAGIALDRILAISQPGSYGITVSRTGWTGPSGPTTLSRHFDITAGSSAPPPVVPTVPPASAAPQITVDHSGTVQAAKFHVVGSGFLKNLPDTNHGVAIRFVDANSLIETRREFTGTNSEGKIDHVIEGDLSGLTRNARGIATAAISATDGTKDPNDSTGFLWSNTETINFK